MSLPIRFPAVTRFQKRTRGSCLTVSLNGTRRKVEVRVSFVLFYFDFRVVAESSREDGCQLGSPKRRSQFIPHHADAGLAYIYAVEGHPPTRLGSVKPTAIVHDVCCVSQGSGRASWPKTVPFCQLKPLLNCILPLHHTVQQERTNQHPYINFTTALSSAVPFHNFSFSDNPYQSALKTATDHGGRVKENEDSPEIVETTGAAMGLATSVLAAVRSSLPRTDKVAAVLPAIAIVRACDSAP